MIIAVIAVWMVKMSVDQIVDVVAVRHWFVSASRTVYMAGIVSPASVIGCAARRVRIANLDCMFFDLAILADVMQVTVVEVVDMVAVLDAGMLAIRAVLVVVVGM